MNLENVFDMNETCLEILASKNTQKKEKNIFEYKVCKNRIIVKFYVNVTRTNNIKFLIIYKIIKLKKMRYLY